MTGPAPGDHPPGFADLPAGPLSSAQARLWRARTSHLVHGNWNCRALQRSAPTALEHPLGQATTLGELSWPEGLHCPLHWVDDPAGRYLRDAREVAAVRALAAELTEAVAAATPTWSGSDRVGNSDWPRLAGLAGAASACQAVTPEDPQLRRLAATARDRLQTAEQRLRDLFRPTWGGRLSPNAAAGRQLLLRVCAAHLVLAQYATHRAGPLWVSFQTRGWQVAAAVLATADPTAHPTGTDPEDLETVADLLTDADIHIGRSPHHWFIAEQLREALLWHGQESWTHHRLWDLATRGAARPWLAWFREWATGATFSWGSADALRRRQLLDPTLFAVVLPALHAADATWTGFLDGPATGARRPLLCVLPEPAVHLGLDGPIWLVRALTLAYPAGAGPGPAGTRVPQRLVVALLPEIAAAALDHAWATPICTVPLPDGVEEPPEWVYGTILGELARLLTATADQVADVVHDILESVDMPRPKPG
jgi:hypothetical protein